MMSLHVTMKEGTRRYSRRWTTMTPWPCRGRRGHHRCPPPPIPPPPLSRCNLSVGRFSGGRASSSRWSARCPPSQTNEVDKKKMRCEHELGSERHLLGGAPAKRRMRTRGSRSSETCMCSLERVMVAAQRTRSRSTAPYLFNDNKGTAQTVNNPFTISSTKHVATKYFRTRQYIAQRLLRVCYVPTTMNISKFFTKALTETPFFLMFQAYLGMSE